ncbi:MAG: hypothetical protein KDA52_12205 [Planctomycetaceae bacterium]|nr:hypothetical protein [Planctomycetaceae bacterium]
MSHSWVGRTLCLVCCIVLAGEPFAHAEDVRVDFTAFRPRLFSRDSSDEQKDDKNRSAFQEPIHAPPSWNGPATQLESSAAASQIQDPLMQLTVKAIEKTQRRYMDANQHRPWQIMHGLVGLRRDLELRDGNHKVNAIEWLSNGATFKGQHWFEVTEHGAKARGYNGTPYEFEGHVNQTLALLAMSNLPASHQFKVAGGRTINMADLVNHAKLHITTREEITWTLWFLTHYVDIDAEWTNVDGELWSIEELVKLQTRANVLTAPCGGTHGLFAIAYARNAHLYKHGDLRGAWLDADQKIQRYIELARSQQNRDGSFSTEYFKGPGYSRDFNERLKASGHMLEWLMMSLPHKRMNEPWVRRAVASVATDLVHNAARPAETGPMYHAVHSLVLYRDRMVQSEKPETKSLAVTKPATPEQPTVSEHIAEVPNNPNLTESSQERIDRVLKAPPVPEIPNPPMTAEADSTIVAKTLPSITPEIADVPEKSEVSVAVDEESLSQKAANHIARTLKKSLPENGKVAETSPNESKQQPELIGPSLEPVKIAIEPKGEPTVR